jgi:hypothetical protein
MPAAVEPDDTFRTSLLTDGGGHIRIRAAHGRLYLAQVDRTGRYVNTTPLSTERARQLAQRLNELCAVAEAMGA